MRGDGVSPHGDDPCVGPDGMTEAEVAEMWAAGEELVVDRREALKAGMRALLDGGVEGLNAFVGRSANRLTAGAHYALQVMVGELHPEVERTALDNYDFGEH